MKITKILAYSAGILMGMVLGGCNQNSPLSEAPLNDPGLVRPEIYLERNTNDDGISLPRTTHEMVVWLYDRNNNSVAIQNGGVSVNGYAMHLKYAWPGNAPYYQIQNAYPEIIPGRRYVFTFTLSNGQQYQAQVKVQNSDLRRMLRRPSYNPHDRYRDLEISWNDISTRYPMRIETRSAYQNSTNSGVEERVYRIPERDLRYGSFIIPKGDFQYPEGIYKLHLKLSSEETGDIDRDFRPGGKIMSILSQEQKIDIR